MENKEDMAIKLKEDKAILFRTAFSQYLYYILSLGSSEVIYASAARCTQFVMPFRLSGALLWRVECGNI